MGSRHRILQPGDGKLHRFTDGELFTWKTLGEDNGGAMDLGELSASPLSAYPSTFTMATTRPFTSSRAPFDSRSVRRWRMLPQALSCSSRVVRPMPGRT